VLTPHPLEAARLLAATRPVQAGPARRGARAGAALRQRGGAEGSGSVIAAPDGACGSIPRAMRGWRSRERATCWRDDRGAAGGGEDAMTAASAAVFLHGLAADRWPAGER
jgi:NAD(P)H-hydrate repair Nnr-like enzyme with NAD(P)H-hydrate dehydratase domain